MAPTAKETTRRIVEALKADTGKPKAIWHPLLKEIEAQVGGTQLQQEVKAAGRTWVIQTLEPEQEEWVASQNVADTRLQTQFVQQELVAAASLVSIDGVSVKKLFAFPPDFDPDALEVYAVRVDLEWAWRTLEVVKFFRSPAMTHTVVEALADAYRDISAKREEALAQLGPSSASTDAGES